MMPNTVQARKKNKELLIECECSGLHFLQVIKWDEEDAVNLIFLEEHASLWQTLKCWWYFRNRVVTDIILNAQDRKALIKALENPEKE